jgi:hypothetical protein
MRLFKHALKIVVASGRLTIKAGRSSYASITILMHVLQVLQHYPAKIPHFFENLQILAFYYNLFTTSLIVY